MRKIIATVAGAAVALSLAACGGSGDGGGGGGDKGTIGVAMPTKSSERWIADGNNIKKQLEAAGYKVDLQYAEDDIPTQVSQVENMVTKGEKMLVIAAIDGTALGDTLQKAEDSDIPIIAYDRLIRESDAVDYYTTFDNEKVGELQAQSLVDGLKAKGKAPYNVELFAGSPDDNNATFFWNGAMKVLQPMIDSGDIKVVSGQTGFKQAAILRWDPATAQKRMEDILTKSYTKRDRRRRPLAVRRTVARHHRGAQVQRLRRKRQAAARRHRSGRRGPVGQVDPRRVSSTRRSSRTRASWPRSRSR